MEQARYDLKFVNNNQSDGIGNRINFDYNIVFSNAFNNVYNSHKYYASSGVAIQSNTDDDNEVWLTRW